jgi:hypothetical protein
MLKTEESDMLRFHMAACLAVSMIGAIAALGQAKYLSCQTANDQRS